MYCPKCSKQYENSAVFCEDCSERLIPTDVSPPSKNDEPAYPKQRFTFAETIRRKKSLPKIFTPKRAIAVTLAVVVLVVSLFTAFHKSDEEKILGLFNDLTVAMNEGDSEKMLSCFEPAGQQKIKSAISIGSALMGSVDFWDLWSLGSIGMSKTALYATVYDISITGKKSAVVDVAMDYGMMGKDRNKVKLVKIKGDWFISQDEISLF